MERSFQDESNTMLNFWKKIGWSYRGKKYLGPEDPIYGYLALWSEVQNYDIMKTCK